MNDFAIDYDTLPSFPPMDPRGAQSQQEERKQLEERADFMNGFSVYIVFALRGPEACGSTSPDSSVLADTVLPMVPVFAKSERDARDWALLKVQEILGGVSPLNSGIHIYVRPLRKQ